MECSLELAPPWPVPPYSESRGDMTPLWRRELLFPNLCLKHDELREESEGFVCEKEQLSLLFMLKDKVVAFNSRSVPRNATDKTSLARLPTSSATLRLKESREGAPRTLGRQKVPRDQKLWKHLLICGPSKFAAQARSAYGPRDRTKALYGPRTQAYGETKYEKL